jgi:4a-hydroxytetrahydrobiopterin dehydratase
MKLRFAKSVSLADKSCPGCEGEVPKLDGDELEFLASEVPSWTVEAERMHREFAFADFGAALAFVNKVGAIAEAEGHHPDLLIHQYRHVRVMLYTHFVNGLTINDFILAAKVDRA